MRIAILALAVLALGLGAYAFFFDDDNDAPERPQGTPPVVGFDHWHAALAIDICGEWLPNAPEFHNRLGETTEAGIHSHGTELVHIHPKAPDEAGANAVLGLFFEYAGWSISADSLSVWDEETHTNGDACPGAGPSEVRWSVDGVEQTGDPGELRLADGQDIVLAFLPASEPLPPAPTTTTTVAE